MKNQSTYYFEVGVNDIPWGRIVHWYGRATDFPQRFADLLTGDEETRLKVINKLGNDIEHQDGIMMATPFALIFLFRTLSFKEAPQTAILQKILVVVKAINFQLESYEVKGEEGQPIISLPELLTEEYLWPVFEEEDKDDELWETFDYYHVHYSWIQGCIDIINAHAALLKGLRNPVADQILALAKL